MRKKHNFKGLSVFTPWQSVIYTDFLSGLPIAKCWRLTPRLFRFFPAEYVSTRIPIGKMRVHGYHSASYNPDNRENLPRPLVISQYASRFSRNFIQTGNTPSYSLLYSPVTLKPWQTLLDRALATGDRPRSSLARFSLQLHFCLRVSCKLKKSSRSLLMRISGKILPSQNYRGAGWCSTVLQM